MNSNVTAKINKPLIKESGVIPIQNLLDYKLPDIFTLTLTENGMK
jgi:hypothetical protein